MRGDVNQRFVVSSTNSAPKRNNDGEKKRERDSKQLTEAAHDIRPGQHALREALRFLS